MARSKIISLKNELATAKLDMAQRAEDYRSDLARRDKMEARTQMDLHAALEGRAAEVSDNDTISREKIEREKRERMERAVRCGVCLEVLVKPDSLTKCGHTFCQDCLFKWFLTRRTCPTCSAVVNLAPNTNDAVEKAIRGLVEINLLHGHQPSTSRTTGAYDLIFNHLPARRSLIPNHLRPIETEEWTNEDEGGPGSPIETEEWSDEEEGTLRSDGR
ncbi:hypothetical protein C8R46DRAFT_1218219 [Mycena filopes]|nr:hypothetical protein C8R46DRAFT_1218219 [Mycena filopes]